RRPGRTREIRRLLESHCTPPAPLTAPADRTEIMRDKKSVRPPPDHGAEGRIDVPFVAGTQEINLLANRTSGRLHCPTSRSAVGLFGFTNMAIRGTAGASSRSSTNLLTSSSD